MAKYSPNDYKKIAVNLKKRFRNVAEENKATKAGVAKVGAGVGGTALAALLAGWVGNKARSEGKADPLAISQAGDFPVMALVGFGIAGSSMLIKKAPKQAPNLKAAVASAGTHIAAGALYKYIYDQSGKMG